MTDDIVARLRAETDGATVNPDGIEAADEIERMRAELAALRENSLAVLTRVRAYRDKVITERDALRALLGEVRKMAENGVLYNEPLNARIDAALKGK